MVSCIRLTPHNHPDPQLRYFVLAGSVLRYYKSERDVGLSPRGAVDVQVRKSKAAPRHLRLPPLCCSGLPGGGSQYAAVPVCAGCYPPAKSRKNNNNIQNCYIALEVEGIGTAQAALQPT